MFSVRRRASPAANQSGFTNSSQMAYFRGQGSSGLSGLTGKILSEVTLSHLIQLVIKIINCRPLWIFKFSIWHFYFQMERSPVISWLFHMRVLCKYFEVFLIKLTGFCNVGTIYSIEYLLKLKVTNSYIWCYVNGCCDWDFLD